METIFQGNIFFLYIIGLLIIVNYDAFTKKQKVMLLYFFTYGLLLVTTISKGKIMMLLVLGLFIYEEFLSDDKSKYKYIVSVIDRIKDFVFLSVFVYKIGYVAIAFILYDNTFGFPVVGSFKMDMIGSIVFMLVACLRMYEERIEFNDFSTIDRIFKRYPYYLYKKDVEKYGYELNKKMHIVAAIEDKTFFMRSNGYSIISPNYVTKWIEAKKTEKQSKYKKRSKLFRKTINLLFRAVKTIWRWLKNKNRLKRLVNKTINAINNICYRIISFASRKKRRYLRGYSTIEMQLLRVLAINRGFYTGSHHKKLFEVHCVIVRKIFELLYTDMFFKNLKREQETINNIMYFREYLVFIYLHVVSTRLNGKTYNPVSRVFLNADVISWPNEALFVASLGLNFSRIDKSRVRLYNNVIDEFSLDRSIILKLIENMNTNNCVG